jgi:hypothetical protein
LKVIYKIIASSSGSINISIIYYYIKS